MSDSRTRSSSRAISSTPPLVLLAAAASEGDMRVQLWCSCCRLLLLLGGPQLRLLEVFVLFPSLREPSWAVALKSALVVVVVMVLLVL
ncbi:hypothetical protein Micbo1qcDRAFT_162405, partial [Microdochium bolleyi]